MITYLMNFALLIIMACGSMCAQTSPPAPINQAQTQTVKKTHPKLKKLRHVFVVTATATGTVVIVGGLLYLMALNPAGVQVH